ncbi:DUF2188 domain-containing protein [Halomonas elongata]|uniref:DUF2188 domain-containing protein n=1 Tax=Halomonas elongata TaxID=2746 RepID=UPI00186B9504|nr:DUF2188 domain-containing protein [Halomonas elongata]MBW5802032.1 DUF2188 domain-containing protein [Halomonas elongata]
MPTNVWVVLHDDGWAVKREGAARATRVCGTQTEAIAYGRQLAMADKVELIIQGEDGKIRDRRSYGNDPYPPSG